MEIEAGPVPQPTNVNVGFADNDPEEADIERQLLEAEANGTSLGEIEDRKAGVKADKPDTAEVEGGTDAKETKEGDEKKPDNSETPAEEKKEQARDEKGKFAKDESKYEKAKKDAARKDTSWKALNEEKATVRAQAEQKEAELSRERAQLEAERARIQEDARNRGQFSPQEYHKASQEFQGAAFKALSSDDPEEVLKAKGLFENAHHCMQAAQRTWEYTLKQARQKDINETISKHPELDDLNSEAGQAMLRLLQENPYLAQLPNGFSKASKFLVAQRDAARVSELEGELKQAIKDRDDAKAQLKSATSLAGAGSQTQPPARNFDDMKDTEQEREVERMFSPNGEFVHA